MTEHYFAADPASPERRRSLSVELAGRRITVQTAAGVFCPDRVDQGTAVLLRHAPAPPPSGALLDLGCGWGPVALTLGLLSPAAQTWAVDVNERALELVRANAALAGADQIRAVQPQDVPPAVRFTAIWSNPPIRVGKAALHELLLQWLPRLEVGGAAYLVVQKNLGSDSLQQWLGDALPSTFDVRRYASDKGFRVLQVVRSAG